jgi:hypothetical protein
MAVEEQGAPKAKVTPDFYLYQDGEYERQAHL